MTTNFHSTVLPLQARRIPILSLSLSCDADAETEMDGGGGGGGVQEGGVESTRGRVGTGPRR